MQIIEDETSVLPGARLRTLLYVEDNPTNLKLVELYLVRRTDLRMLSARDGKSGIEIARVSRPGVIVMDINLPDISGFRALEILRSDPATSHIPVIALSANALTLNVESGLEAGFFRYLTKPIQSREFLDTLDLALEFAVKSAARRRQRSTGTTASPGAVRAPAK